MVILQIEVDGKPASLYMDNRLYDRVEKKIKPRIEKKDKDSLYTIDGMEGCQPKGSKVLMANGEWKNIEDIKVGELVLSPQLNGEYIYSKVLKTISWYSFENYDVCELARKNRKLYSCSYNHLIPINYKVKPRINGKRLSKDSYWQIRNFQTFEYNSLSRHTKKNITTLTTFPIKNFYNRENCKIEPYTLGVILGDGCITNNHLSITGINKEILEEVNKFYPIMRISSKQKTKALSYHFSKQSLLKKYLDEFRLYDCNSGSKFIPKDALLSDIEYRKRLLAGLIDTDGYMSKHNNYSICTKSKQLADDIFFLIYSLGGRASINKIKKGIKKRNFVGNYYNISFYLSNLNIPLQVKRKIRDKKFFYLSANRISINTKLSEPNLVYGFELDNESKWYITDNFVITHNSGKSVFAFQLAKVLDPNFNLNKVCMSPEEFTKAVMKAKKGDCIVYDEAFTGLSSKGSLSEINRMIVSLMMEMRQKNLYVLVVMPTFFMLEKYVALYRSRGLFHIYEKHGKRGYWAFFNNRKKNLLYLLGKKLFSYSKPRSKFIGRFADQYTINEEAYRQKKREALNKKSRLTKYQVILGQRNSLIYLLYKKMGRTQSQISDMFKEVGYTLARNTISEIITDFEKALQQSKEDDEAKNENIDGMIEQEAEVL